MRDTFKFIPTLAVAFLAPLPFGSVETAWLAVWCAVLGGAVAAASLRKLQPAHLGLIAPVLTLFLFTCLVAWLQSRSGSTFGPPNPIWFASAELLALTPSPRVSVNAFPWWRPLGPPLAMFLAFLAGFLTSTSRSGAWTLLRTVAWAGALYALYALGGILYNSAAVLLSDQAARLAPLTGPFVNRNHAATFFGTSAVLWLLITLSSLERRLGRGALTWAHVAPTLLTERPWQLGFQASAFVVCLTATFLTLSRAGVLLTLATLAFSGGMFASRWLSGHPRLPLIAGVALLLGAVVTEVWGGSIGYRIGMEGLVDAGRREAYRATLAIIRDFPLLGTGLGSFEAVFPAYRTAAMATTRVWDYAHSTPLQLAAEQGLPLAIAAGAVWIIIGAFLFRGVLIRNRDAVLPLAGLAVGLLGTLHSVVDFPLQVPGYTIVWAAIVGGGLAQSVPGAPKRDSKGGPIRTGGQG